LHQTEFRMRKKKKQLSFFIILSLLLLALVLLALFIHPLLKPHMFRINTCKCDFCKDTAAPVDSTALLDDLNVVQLEHAQIGGLRQTFDTDSDFLKSVDGLLKKDVLVKIEDCRFFHIDQLKHSHPYLVPEAVNLLKDIGVEFHKRLKSNGMKPYRFVITSVLRTDESQHKLGRHNTNATTNSAHCYGTTFDITYNKFMDGDSVFYPAKVPVIFKQTLVAMRLQCRFLIKKEHRQSCYHITVVICRESLANRRIGTN